MEHYVDIKVLPDEEISVTFLMNTIYTKLHKVLYDLSSTNIGVSFPKHKVTLGNVLRIHGEKSALYHFQSMDWMGGMMGYCAVSSIKHIPKDSKFRTVSRKQMTMSQSKLRRLMKRGSMSGSEIGQYKAKMLSQRLSEPYVELVSSSNGHRHRRYIAFGQLLDEPIAGEFDQFGLSKTATVPWF